MADARENRPPPAGGGGSGGTVMLGVVALVLVALVAWFLLSGDDRGDVTEVNVELPEADAPEIEVPEEIDVDVSGSGR